MVCLTPNSPASSARFTIARWTRHWPDAIGNLRAGNFAAGGLEVADLATRVLRFQENWNFDPVWLDRVGREYAADVAEIWASVPESHDPTP